jgi:hypothetical protein
MHSTANGKPYVSVEGFALVYSSILVFWDVKLVIRYVVLMFQKKIMVLCWTLEPLQVTQTVKTSETMYSLM